MPLGSESWATPAEAAPHKRTLPTMKRDGNRLKKGDTRHYSATVRGIRAWRGVHATSKTFRRNGATARMTMIVVAGGTASFAQTETGIHDHDRARLGENQNPAQGDEKDLRGDVHDTIERGTRVVTINEGVDQDMGGSVRRRAMKTLIRSRRLWVPCRLERFKLADEERHRPRQGSTRASRKAMTRH